MSKTYAIRLPEEEKQGMGRRNIWRYSGWDMIIIK